VTCESNRITIIVTTVVLL